MGRIVHRGPGGYRVWSTVVDQYLTPVLTRAEVILWLSRHDDPPLSMASEPGARVARADASGTSRIADTRSVEAWDTERCDGCGDFHHAYRARPDGTCAGCGDPEAHPVHGTPCEEAIRG